MNESRTKQMAILVGVFVRRPKGDLKLEKIDKMRRRTVFLSVIKAAAAAAAADCEPS